MRRLLITLAALAALSGAAEAQNTVVLTPGTGVTLRSVNVGSGVQSLMQILGDSSGNALATAPGTGNTAFALPMQGVAGGVALPVSASALPLPTGAATLAKQPALGTAGTASTDVISVQGIASMTPFLVNPGTPANWGVGTSTQNSATASNGNLALGQFNTSPTTITSGNMSPLQLDNAGNMKVNVVAGGAGGGAVFGPTAAGTAAANPPVLMGGTANGGATGNVQNWKVDASGFGYVSVANANVNGQAIAANSSPVVEPVLTNGGAAVVKGGVAVVNGGSNYQEVAASQTATVLQTSTGAVGDYLSHCVIYPATTGAGLVTVFDSTNSATNNVIQFVSGTLSNLAPIAVPVGAISVNGAWKVTTGANVAVVCYGKFS